MVKKIAILGSTGSIGKQALEIVAASDGQLAVSGLAAGENLELFIEQIKKYKPQAVSVRKPEDAAKIKQIFPDLAVYSGETGLTKIATLPEIELVLVAVVGVAALQTTIEAIKQKKDIALASKEVLVAAGELIMPLVRQYGVKLLPVDSEHSAVMQALNPQVSKENYFVYPAEKIKKIILTASGGAFRDLNRDELTEKTFADALKHPIWQMGRKITIDSATLINKGLEVIEAHWLFGVNYDEIEVVIHPQSIIHSLVEFVDGSVLAQLGLPDMRLPIQYALYYPERRSSDRPKLDLIKTKQLTFKEPDKKTFKGLQLAYQAGKTGGTMPAVFNAANEAAVNLFVAEKIKFLDIAESIAQVMAAHQSITKPTLEQIIAADQWARNKITELIIKKVKV